MKFCRFNDNRVGIVRDGMIQDITDHVPPPVDGAGDPLILALPRLAALAAVQGERRIAVADAKLLSPVRAPTKIMAASSNYSAHEAEMISNAAASFGRGATKGLLEEGLFLKANSSLVGPSQGVALRHLDRRTDHEIELVVVIGRHANNVSEADALSYVAGYAVGLDITLRGPEERSQRKSLDSYTVLGPWLTTADEVPDPMAIDLRLSIGSDIRQNSSTSGMIAGVRTLIAYASRYYVLNPGDLIYTGTPEGVGPILPGAVLRASASGLGEMDVAIRAAG